MPVSRSKKRKSAKNESGAHRKYKKGYKSSYAPIAKEMCRLGATATDLATAFGVTLDVITLWQATDEEFSDACKISDEKATDRVESSLHQRACGYDLVVPKIVKLGGKMVMVDTPKHIPANVNAAIFGLCNRRPDRWKDAKRIQEPARESSFHTLFQGIAGHVLRPVENPPDDIVPARVFAANAKTQPKEDE